MKHLQGVTVLPLVRAWGALPCYPRVHTTHIVRSLCRGSGGRSLSPRVRVPSARSLSHNMALYAPGRSRLSRPLRGRTSRSSGQRTRQTRRHPSRQPPRLRLRQSRGGAPPSPVARWPPSSPQGGPRQTGSHPRREAASALRGRPRPGGEPRHRKGSRPGRASWSGWPPHGSPSFPPGRRPCRSWVAGNRGRLTCWIHGGW